MSANIVLLGPNDIFFLYPVLITAFFLMRPLMALIATLTSIVFVTVSIHQHLPMFETTKILFSLLATAFFAFTFAWQRNRQSDDLHKLSRVDQLTGVGNRRALREKLDDLVLVHARDKQPMSLIILDLDDFKIVNDQHGHLTGDDVLIKICTLMRQRIRATDYLFRYGGDEFMILANNSDLSTSSVLAEDIRRLIDGAQHAEHGRVSVSIGVSEYRLGESPDQWLARADSAMYSVKRSGKNAVSTDQSESPMHKRERLET
jgi:diguanylate cyclase (GGDEF)-like protein